MIEQDTILGFQLRVSPKSLSPWPPERRKQYLLRQDIKLPLGIDESVWPRIEDADPLQSLFDDYVGGPRNSLHVHLSTSLRQIETCATGTVIFLTASSEDATEIKRWCKIGEPSLELSALRSHGFIRLGFDVAPIDAGWSVLNDTDPGESTRAELSEKFAAALDSEHGLFIDWRMADQYREAWKRIEGWKTHPAYKETLCPFGIWARPQDLRK